MASCPIWHLGWRSNREESGSIADTHDCLLLSSLCVTAAAAKQGGSAAEALQKPLHILHGILRDVASRLALNEAVVWVRNAAKAPPWAKLLRVEKSVLFSMGVRSVHSHTQLNSILHRECSAKNASSSILSV